uniref:Uncharacterized protein n=1 Tax=viral metagenome TaxID=1070528 RepID=A0A6C0CNT5_9ZZZZ
MADTTTRIMDLPENVTIQMNTHSERGNGINTSYSPIDVHPNPYGHPPPSVPSLPTPSSNPPQRTMQDSIPQVQQRLPSRDIPIDQNQFTQDPQIQANYVPPVSEPVKRTTEYMRQYDEINERKIAQHQTDKDKKSRMDLLYEEGQIPILVAVLFFIFHMPVVLNFLYKTFSFLKLHDLDGHFNMYGLIAQSAFFGGLFYGMTKTIHTLSEL